jgi:aspartate/methionine/tyrosine aminotransferase
LILTPGTQGGLFTSLSALVTPGDAIAVPALEYFMDERIGAYLGARIVRVEIDYSEDGTMSVSEDALDAAAREGVRGLVLSHPNNPTGALYDPTSLRRMAAWAVAQDLWVVADQLYCRLVFDGRTYGHIGSLPNMTERTVTLLGPSKTESMSGYRVGVAVGPPPVIDAIEQVVSMASLRTAGYTQHTLRHWMDGDETWLKDRIVAHEALRDQLVSGLRAISGMRVNAPAGSSYVFPDISGTPWGVAHDGDDFAFTRVAKSAGVLVSPGYQFGPAGRGHFRINFSQDAERLRRCVEVIGDVLSAS